MSKTVILEDGEIEILLSYHKERLARATEEILALTAQKEASEHRLHELGSAHEYEHEAAAEAHATESEGLHLTEDGVLAEDHAHDTADITGEPEEGTAAHEEPTAETEHEDEAAELHSSVEPTGSHHVDDETSEHEAAAAHEQETTNEEEPENEDEHAHSAETAEAEEKGEIAHEPVTADERHKGTFPA